MSLKTLLNVICTSILVMFGIVTTATAAIIIPGGNVSGAWNSASSPYTVQGDITVLSQDTLIIEEGVIAQFSDSDSSGGGSNPSEVEFIINGELIVDGGSTGADIVAQNGSSSSWHGITAFSGSTIRLSNARLQGDLFLNAGSDYFVQLIDATNFDNAEIGGSISLNGNLVLDTDFFSASLGDSFVLLMNDGVDPISGAFNGLSEGALLSLGGVDFNLTYVGGDGNDIVLSSVPVPAAVWLFGSGLLGLLVSVDARKHKSQSTMIVERRLFSRLSI